MTTKKPLDVADFPSVDDLRILVKLPKDSATHISNLEQCYKAARRELAESSNVEIRTDPSGALDEICAAGVHLEQMASNHWFLSVGEVNVWLSAKGKIAVTYEDNRAAIDVAPLRT